MLADVLGSAAAAIFQSCHKHSLNEIRAAAALNAFGAVLSACMKEPGMVLITGAGKEPQAEPSVRSVKIHQMAPKQCTEKEKE